MIDIGTNIGIFARPSAELFERVICFEPVRKNFEVIAKNLENYSNVELYCLGISNQPQIAKFSLKTMKCGQSQQVDHFSTDPEYENFECE